ncbi:GGDEF domain-containing protein [Pelotomaculum terephthalicicum JT]|uniref:GGDEF domain-containing protein n=1 Tax=Pelotomaculum TaxID=191373 RepID=UPI0009C59E1E|nr:MULTISPECIES: GGDEF domain-containing protein [Pelotomaculum]MCG9969315.1 GGDEF domain-containing protein [Pelotomaculum terephthalicicum JT]OPX87224.1 MAG: Diguanylate cyclase DosC [Pelotomaculum sp. PtaB.Bin117]OPY62402.1 MAG: Diguanylate cyclase DosC [Pelotomaculum sp. PtaU1.Bin065]
MVSRLTTRQLLIKKVEEMIYNREGPFSIVVADIDNLENINNTYSPKIGDEIIDKLVSIFMNNLSENDLSTRQGDEFMILLVGKGAERSLMEMEEIRRYLSDNTFGFSDGEIQDDIYVTISCGIASWPRDAKNAIELLRVADSALFRAKKLGKNKVCLSEVESMVLKSSYFTKTQIDRLSELAKEMEKTEAFLLREALDDLFKKYSK